MKRKDLSVKIFLFLIFIDVLETFAQFCFKKSVCAATCLGVHNFSEGLKFINAVIPSPFLWLGLFTVLAIFISWSTVLSRIDLSVAVPVCSFSYISVPLVSVLLFHEKISILRWSGIFVILLGVIFVSISSRIKEKTQ